MPVRSRVLALCAASLLAAAAAHAAAPDPAALAAAEQKFADELARDNHLNREAVLATLAKARYQQSIIDAISRPAEAKPWKDYRPIFVTDRRIDDGVAFLQANAALLKRVENEFGVPATLIVTILGVETNYGRITGRYRVLDALTTLAFSYPPRQDFFRSELKQLFLLHESLMPYPTDQLMGSYAGAMGWGQFMPSSVANFARDYDGDGKVDLWNSLPDICASVANYFVAHGWQKGGSVAVRANVAADARAITPNGLEPVYPLQQLDEWGYHTTEKLDPMMPATLIVLDGADGRETWLTFENFYAISRYNKSPLYSLAVYQLSQAIAAGAAEPGP
ncbi:MAG TPA: lytic murein transglycosylase B [Rudaea sp.]|nr:lytic murein transglycosylase B [Rudaea sp.]